MILATIILSFVIAAAIPAFVKKQRVIMEAASIGAGVIAVVAALLLAYKVGTHGAYSPYKFVLVDSLAALITLVVSIVGCMAAIYAVPYLRKETAESIIGTRRIRQYHLLVNLFLAATVLAVTASNPMMAWIFLEATTLTTAFLVSYYNRASTIEAAWKYLIINAVGLLLAFFGTLLFFTAFAHDSSVGLVTWQLLTAHIGSLNPDVVRMAFIFVLIGYGTKIGLAPMHTWKPDAYSKAPAPIGALFSGALMPVAFVVLLRFKSVTDAAIGPQFSQHLLIAFGILSMLVAAMSILTIRNYKRMLAHSSIEHAGIVALGFGFGSIGTLAGLLHLIYHSFVKPALFFLTGNMLIKFHSAEISKVRGVMSIIPATGVLFFVGLFAATGFPPFGMFFTEFFTLSAGIKVSLAITAIALLAIVIVFVGFLRQTSAMMLSDKQEAVERGEGSTWLLVPPVALLALTLVITFYTPPFVRTLIHNAIGQL